MQAANTQVVGEFLRPHRAAFPGLWHQVGNAKTGTAVQAGARRGDNASNGEEVDIGKLARVLIAAAEDDHLVEGCPGDGGRRQGATQGQCEHGSVKLGHENSCQVKRVSEGFVGDHLLLHEVPVHQPQESQGRKSAFQETADIRGGEGDKAVQTDHRRQATRQSTDLPRPYSYSYSRSGYLRVQRCPGFP